VQEIKANLYHCAHCEGSGTCRTGYDGRSCTACVNKNELKGKDHFGIMCGSCGGLGQAEPITERMNKRAAPILASVIVIPLLMGIFWAAVAESKFFSEILTFSSALIGTIIGFYFSGKRA
jgi:hypothetical protein